MMVYLRRVTNESSSCERWRNFWLAVIKVLTGGGVLHTNGLFKGQIPVHALFLGYVKKLWMKNNDQIIDEITKVFSLP